MSRVTETEINELLQLYRAGDKEAGELLLTKLRPLVRALVRRYANEYHGAEDLEQVGYIGLLKAIERYDPSAGAKLTTFAVKWITGEILIYLRRGHDLLKRPHASGAAGAAKMSNNAINAPVAPDANTANTANAAAPAAPHAKNPTRKTNMNTNSLADLAAINGVSPEEAAASAEYPCLLLFPGEEKMAVIASERSYDEEVVRKTWLKEALLSLPPVERQVIYYRYFEEKSQQQVAQILGLTQKQVSRLEKKVLQKMKESMQESTE